ncbi:hypothetical protein JCM1393_01010 [Clostridium carnis]
MKRYLKLIISLLLICILPGCALNKPQYIISKNKPNDYYYTSEIYSRLMNKKPYTIKIFDLNVYKYYDVNPEEHSIILEFIDSLNNDSYGKEIDENITPRFKVIIEFSDEKFIINAYNDEMISIHPWDGVYDEDKISMKGVKDYYNIYKFCEYIEKVSRGFEG